MWCCFCSSLIDRRALSKHLHCVLYTVHTPSVRTLFGGGAGGVLLSFLFNVEVAERAEPSLPRMQMAESEWATVARVIRRLLLDGLPGPGFQIKRICSQRIQPPGLFAGVIRTPS